MTLITFSTACELLALFLTCANVGYWTICQGSRPGLSLCHSRAKFSCFVQSFTITTMRTISLQGIFFSALTSSKGKITEILILRSPPIPVWYITRRHNPSRRSLRRLMHVFILYILFGIIIPNLPFLRPTTTYLSCISFLT